MFWIGTWDGLNMFDEQRGQFRTFRHDPDNPMSLSSSDIKSVYVDRSGTLWIGTESGLNKYDRQTGTFKVFRNDPEHADKLTNDVKSILEDNYGNLWIATSDGGVCIFDRQREQFTLFMNDPSNPGSLSSDKATVLYEDNARTLWVGTLNGLNRFNREKQEFTAFKNNPRNANTLSSNGISAIFQDRSGSMWIGTRVGLNKFDRQRPRFHHIKNFPEDPNSLSRDFIYPILEDKFGLLWIGTWGGGLNRLDRENGKFTSFRHRPDNAGSLSSDAIRAIVEDDSGTLWVGTEDNGLNRFDRMRQRFTTFSPETASSKKPYADHILSMTLDKSGILWVGTLVGLYSFDRQGGAFHEFDHSSPDTVGLTKQGITALLEGHAGTLWIGTDGGLYRFDQGTNEVTRFTHDPRNPLSLSSNRIISICEAKSGTLWVGTNRGLNQFIQERREWKHFTVQDGLPDDMIYSVLEDDRGNLWIGTNKGLSRFNIPSGRFKNYDMRDGVQGGEFNTGSCFRSSRGELFFGGVNGLNAFFPDSISDNPTVPPVVITSFKKFYKEFKLPKDITATDEIVLSHDDDVFSFEFAALNFIQPEKNQYAYKLEGFDGDWIYSGSEHTATYTHLDPSEYVFRVKGSNNDGLWNEKGASIAIVISPAFWSTWWFRVFGFVAILLSVGGSIRYVEMKKLKRKIEQLENERALERERLRISQDMHDEVGAGLTEIGILSELAKRNIRSPQEAEIQMQRVSETSRETIASIGEIIWAINPKNDMLDDLVAYLRHYTARYLGQTGITVNFDIPESIPDFHVSAESRRNVFLVIKETLHNIVKHSKATAVIMTISFTKGHLDIIVKDNGKGFSASDTSRFGNGLHNMEKRMSTIGGGFVIESKPGEGTSVAIGLEF
jgi:ligand-binding sensor domain-containing protein/signal transduction histidine kinase